MTGNKLEKVQLSEALPLIYSQINRVVKTSIADILKELQSPKEKKDDLESDYLSAKQAANFLRVNLDTIYYLVKSSQIPYSRVGQRKLIFSKKELIEFVESKKSKSSSQIKSEATNYTLKNSLL